MARYGADGRDQCGRSEPHRVGASAGDLEAAATRRETRGTAPVGPRPVANLRVPALTRSSAGGRSQAADPACRESGKRVHPVTSGPAVPASVSESVSGLASTAGNVCARRSVVLPADRTAPTDARRGQGDQGHGHRSRVRHVPTGTLAVLAQRLNTVSASPSTWYRLVRTYGWRRPRLRIHPAKPKVELRASGPDEIWHIDTTVIRLLDGTRAYLHAVIDNFSRRILAWRVADTFAPGNTVAVLLEATRAATRPASDPVVLADGGVENVNAQVDALIESGVLRRLLAFTELKFSNSMIEAWWRSLKHQWLFLHSLDSVATIRRLVAFYVHEYNTRAAAFGVSRTDAGRDVLRHRRRRAGRPDVTHGRRAPSTRRGQSIGVMRDVSVSQRGRMITTADTGTRWTVRVEATARDRRIARSPE